MELTKTVPAVKARIHFGAIMKRAVKYGERFIVEKSGLPMVVIVNAREYLSVMQEREERFKVLDRIRGSLPDRPSDEIASDVQHALHAIRKRRA